MPQKYGVYADNFTTATSVKTACLLWPDAAGEECEIVELIMTGAGATAAADTQHTARFIRMSVTSVGTGTTQTPEPFKGTRAALASAAVEFSVEPGGKATVFPVHFGFNQRGGMRWAVPQGEGVVVRNSDTNLKGGWEVISQAAGAIDANVQFWEP